MSLITQKTTSVNHVGPVFDNWFQQSKILAGVVFQVSVLNDHNVACDILKTGSECSALALVDVMEACANLVEVVADGFFLQLLHDVARTITAAVVHQNQFFANRHLAHEIHQIAQGLFFVVHGNDHGQTLIFWNRVQPQLTAGGFAQRFLLDFVPLRRPGARAAVLYFFRHSGFSNGTAVTYNKESCRVSAA